MEWPPTGSFINLKGHNDWLPWNQSYAHFVIEGRKRFSVLTDLRRKCLRARRFIRVLNIPMRLVDMVLFQAEHDDYHLARISEQARLFVK